MLILSRRKKESIIFTLPNGQTITVSVASTHAYRVRLGIEAPDNVEIMRSELVEKEKRGNNTKM